MNHRDVAQWPVPVTSLSPVSSATVVWRHEGRLMLTVVVKATCKWVPGGTAELIEPAPIYCSEQKRPGGVVEVSDLAPALQQAEVTAWGMRASADETDVALVVGVGQRRLVVKQARVGGPLISCFAPLSAAERRQLSPGQTDSTAAPHHRGDILDVADNFDGSALQQAPVDQRLQALRGDEWIATRGMHPQHHELATRLPAHYAMVRLYGGDALPQVALPLPLRSIHLLVHELRGSLVWRAHWPLLSNSIPEDLQVATGIAPFGEILELGDLPPSDIIEEPNSERDPWQEMRSTRAVTDDDIKSMAKALPSFIAGEGARPDEAIFARHSNQQTVPLPQDLGAALEQAFRKAAPFELADKSGLPPPADRNAIPGAPWSNADAPVPPRTSEFQIETVSEAQPSAQAELLAGAEAAAAAARQAEQQPLQVQQQSATQHAAQQARAQATREAEEQRAQQAAQQARAQAAREAQERHAQQAEQQARAQAAREAQERRAQQAERFAQEQRQAKLREQERKLKEAQEQRDKRLNLRSSFYAGAKKQRA